MFGIHFIVSCTDYRVVHENMHYGSNVLTRFTERFVFGLSDSDAGYLIEGASVASLRDNTVCYSDCIRNTCQIRPYLFPEAGELGAYIEGGMDDGRLPRSDGRIHPERTNSADIAGSRSAVERLGALCGDGGSALPGGRSAEEERRRRIDRMSDLGEMYRTGRGVKKDYEAAKEWCGKAAEKGSGAAMNSLGYMYESGELGEPNKSKKPVMKWYKKAAENGYFDDKSAMERYKKAAENGDWEALHKLDTYTQLADLVRKGMDNKTGL